MSRENHIRALESLKAALENLKNNVIWAGIRGSEVRITFNSDEAAEEFHNLFEDPITLCVDDEAHKP